MLLLLVLGVLCVVVLAAQLPEARCPSWWHEGGDELGVTPRAVVCVLNKTNTGV
jgi:hypothetical protein